MKHAWVGLFAASLSASAIVSVQCSVNNAGVVDSKTVTDPVKAEAVCDAGPQLYASALGSAEFGPYSAFARSSVVAINVVNPSSGVHSASARATTSYSETVIIPGIGSGFMQIDLSLPAGSSFSTYSTSFTFGSYSVSRSSGGPFIDPLLTVRVPIQFGEPIFVSATATQSIAIPFFGGVGSGGIGFYQFFKLLDSEGQPYQGWEGLSILPTETSIPEPSSVLLLGVSMVTSMARGWSACGRRSRLIGLRCHLKTKS